MKRPSLEGYTRAVWALIGTGVLVLGVVGTTMLGVKLIREMTDDDRVPSAARVADGQEGGEIVPQYDFCRPIIQRGSPFQLIRVASDRMLIREASIEERVTGSLRKFKYGGKSSQTCAFQDRELPAAIVNVLIRDADSGEMRPALGENARIYTLDYPSVDADDSEFPPVGTLFWEIASEDTSGDGLVDERDDVGAYLSDADGRNRVRITPAPSRVLEHTYDAERKVLLLQVLRDTNGDRKLDAVDFPSLFEARLAARGMATEVLDPKLLSAMMREAEPKVAAEPR